MRHVTCMMGRDCMHAGFCWGDFKEGDRLEGQGADGRIIVKWIVKKKGGLEWRRFMWLRRGTFGFRKMRQISRLVAYC